MENVRYIKSKLVLNGHAMKELEQLLGVSKATLWRKMYGKSEFKTSEIRVMCNFLGITVDEFFNAKSCINP